MESLNKLAESHTSDEINGYIIYCVLNAPNAFEFLKLSFDLVVHPQRSDKLCNRILNIMNLVTRQIHAYVYEATNSTFDNTFPIISLLRNNIQQLIAHPSIARNTSLKKLQLRLLNLVCICYGSEFITEVFHNLMNFSTYQISLLNFEDVKLNPLLLPLFNSLRLHFGFSTVQNCIKDTLKLYYPKKLVYWAFMSEFVETHAISLDTSDLIAFLRQKSFDRYENIFRKYFILKILSKLFESNQKLYNRHQYSLCVSLVDTFFELMFDMQSNDGQYLAVIMHSIVMCQRLLSYLAINLTDNEYIIARYLLDFVQAKSELFQHEYSISNGLSNGYEKVLLDENFLKYGHAHKVKKIRLLPFCKANRKKETISNKCAVLNKQLLIDLLQSCVRDKAMFAKNFVNSMSSELLLNDAPWMLDEDPKDGQIHHLRVSLLCLICCVRLTEFFCR